MSHTSRCVIFTPFTLLQVLVTRILAVLGTHRFTFLHLMACSIKNAPPTEAAVNKLLSKVGGTLEQALIGLLGLGLRLLG